MATPARLDDRVEAIRRFNRLYTRRIGVLHEDYLHSPLTLSQVRVLYEAHRDPPPSAADLGRELDLDAAYLSRMLKGFERGGLVRRAASRGDGRKSLVTLTAKGRRTLDELQERSRAEVAALLAPLPAAAQQRLLAAMQTIEQVLGGAGAGRRAVPAAGPPARRHGLGGGAARPRCTPTSTAGTWPSRRTSPASPSTSSSTSTRPGSAAGSPSATARSSGRCSW